MSKPLDTVQLLLALIGLIKSASIAISVVSVEWAMAKASHSKKNQMIAENELEAEKEKNQEGAKDEGSTDIVDRIVERQGGVSGKGEWPH